MEFVVFPDPRTGESRIRYSLPMKRKSPPTKTFKRPAKRTKTNPRLVALASKAFELKNFDAGSTARIVAAQTTATIVSLFQPDQGTAPNEHVGRSLKATSLEYNFQVSMAATSVGGSAVRLAIVYDRQPNAALPAVGDVWQTDEIEAFRNLNNQKRFKVLVDQKLDGVSTAGPTSLYNNGFRKFSVPLETEFNNVNGGTIADITTGSYIAFVWQVGTIITANPDAVLFTRIRYVD